MKYIKFTYVDVVTNIPVTKEPAKNGPKFPDVVGLKFEWARESEYPINYPTFFGTCPDDSDILLDGIFYELSEVDYIQMWKDELSLRKIKTVSMRQARLQLATLGVYDQVNAAIDTMDSMAKIEWEYASEVNRSNILVDSMAQLLSWTEEDIDTYFDAASKL